MAVERYPLARWKYPRTEVIENQVFASSRPPFAPFPDVRHLINACFCPVALYHDLLHGIRYAVMGRLPWEGRGELFHSFVADLKLSIRNGDLELRGDIPFQQQTIQNRFLEFTQSQHIPLSASNDIWRRYIEPWTRRKLQNNELQSISSDIQFFFEVSVANSRIPFPLNGGVRNYPLRGRIDEIDLSHSRIIERTSIGERDAEQPPLLKDYQIWLLWKILCSLEGEELPSSWRNINYETFELVVETPYRDLIVIDNPEFISRTHWAYAWINDLSISESPGIFREVFENAQCAPAHPNEDCAYPFINCFPRRFLFPQSRPEIRQTFQPWYRLLLWEQMWNGHLWHYQILTLNRQELVDLGLVVEARVISTTRNNQIELEIMGRSANPLRGYTYCTIIPYGTVSCGLTLNARITRTENNRIFLQIRNVLSAISEEALLLISPDVTTPIVKEPPIFLDRKIQTDLFRLKYIGTQNRETAQRRSVIQLLEAIFGTRQLRRGLEQDRSEEEEQDSSEEEEDE